VSSEVSVTPKPSSRPGKVARIDAHVHLSQWWPEIQRTGYRRNLEYTALGLLKEMDRNGIDIAVAIQLFQAPTPVEALDEGRRLFEDSGGRLLPVATVDPTEGEESVRQSLDRMEREPNLFGIKLFPGYRPFFPHDARLGPVYEFAHRRELPVLIHQGDTLDGLGLLKFARPVEVDEVAGRYRDVRLVLCHLGNPWIEEAAEVVYKNPNVYADTSGLLGPPSSPYFDRAVASARERIEHAVVASGLPERFLYGSDWPLEELATALRLIELLELDEQDRRAILGGNARQLFRLDQRLA
jgi:uncharacterized protein